MRRTDYCEAYRHKEPDEMIDDLEHGPFLGTKEFPGPRGENESVPGGDGQGTDEEVLVGRQVGRKLEGVWKKACVGSVVRSAIEMRKFWGRTDDVGHDCEGDCNRKGGRARLD